MELVRTNPKNIKGWTLGDHEWGFPRWCRSSTALDEQLGVMAHMVHLIEKQVNPGGSVGRKWKDQGHGGLSKAGELSGKGRA